MNKTRFDKYLFREGLNYFIPEVSTPECIFIAEDRLEVRVRNLIELIKLPIWEEVSDRTLS